MVISSQKIGAKNKFNGANYSTLNTKLGYLFKKTSRNKPNESAVFASAFLHLLTVLFFTFTAHMRTETCNRLWRSYNSDITVGDTHHPHVLSGLNWSQMGDTVSCICRCPTLPTEASADSIRRAGRKTKSGISEPKGKRLFTWVKCCFCGLNHDLSLSLHTDWKWLYRICLDFFGT